MGNSSKTRLPHHWITASSVNFLPGEWEHRWSIQEVNSKTSCDKKTYGEFWIPWEIYSIKWNTPEDSFYQRNSSFYIWVKTEKEDFKINTHCTSKTGSLMYFIQSQYIFLDNSKFPTFMASNYWAHGWYKFALEFLNAHIPLLTSK